MNRKTKGAKEFLRDAFYSILIGMFAITIVVLGGDDGYLKDKKLASLPMPAFEELEKVEGKVKYLEREIERHRGITGDEYDGVVICLENGEKFYLSEHIYSLLRERIFFYRKGEPITLWVSDLEQASLNGKTPVIFQISMDGTEYLSYEETYKETVEFREHQIKWPIPFLIVLYAVFFGTFMVGLIYYKRTGRIPKWMQWVFGKIRDEKSVEMDEMNISDEKSERIEEIRATVYGKVYSVEVECGQQVRNGDAVVVLEALQMRIPMSVSGDGVIKEIYAQEGDIVEKDALLIQVEKF